MSESVRTASRRSQSPTILSIDALEEIVRNCQRNEQRLHELERHTRHERKKAERLLRETSRTLDDHSSHNNSQLDTQRSSKEFFVQLDDEEPTNNSHQPQRQDQHLLERVEKLLAGDGTTTSSEVMSSQERKKKVPSPPADEELQMRASDYQLKPPRQLPSACSIEYELSTVDRLLSEQTPTQQRKSTNENPLIKSPLASSRDEKDVSLDQRDEQFYRRLNSYVHTGRFISSDIEREKPSIKSSHRDEELNDLARRCEDLLGRLHAQRHRAEMLENSTHSHEYYRRLSPTASPRSHQSTDRQSHHLEISSYPTPPPPMSLQQSLELLRPDFISRSRQRARRIRLLREEREHNAEIDRERQHMLLFSSTKPTPRALSASSSHRSVSFVVPYERPPPSSRLPLTYREMKRATQKKYQQLPEVHNRRRQIQMEELRQRNLLRAKVFRARLRQYVVRHGRTNIDESLTMVDV